MTVRAEHPDLWSSVALFTLIVYLRMSLYNTNIFYILCWTHYWYIYSPLTLLLEYSCFLWDCFLFFSLYIFKHAKLWYERWHYSSPRLQQALDFWTNGFHCPREMFDFSGSFRIPFCNSTSEAYTSQTFILLYRSVNQTFNISFHKYKIFLEKQCIPYK